MEKLHSIEIFPAFENRDYWKNLADNPGASRLCREVFRMADNLVGEPMESLSAAKYMDFIRKGDRANFEKDYFSRRNRLAAFVFAEAFRGDGRYIDSLIDVICAITEEYTWCLPAHTHQADPLPFFENEQIDLFSAETSCLLAQTLAIFEKVLEKHSPNLVKRMRKVLTERAVTAMEKVDIEPYFWMTGRNNWTPWVISNLLMAANFLLKDEPERFSAYAERMMPGLERYMEKYPEDGCCSEGPCYWNKSVLRYFLAGEILHQASDGKIDLLSDPKFLRMAEYICAAYLQNNSFVPFGDAPLHVGINFGVLQVMAERLNSDLLKHLVASAVKDSPVSLRDLLSECAPSFPAAAKAETVNFSKHFPLSQQYFRREGNVFLAVKGGHNGEPHNHNDIGQFFFAVGDQYAVIDPGTTVYTRTTFSDKRYTEWCRNSSGHNAFTFDAEGQSPGEEFKCSNYSMEEKDGMTRIFMDLAGCYPKELKLTTYTREILFDGKLLTVVDNFDSEIPHNAKLRLYSMLSWLPLKEKLPFRAERILIKDASMKKSWGDVFYCHTLDLTTSTHRRLTMTFDAGMI